MGKARKKSSRRSPAAKKKTVRARPRKKSSFWSEFTGHVSGFVEALAGGADPIEAMGGHVCNERCWHYGTMLMLSGKNAADAWVRLQREHRWTLTMYDSQGEVVEEINRPVAISLDHAIRDAERNDRVVRAEATGRGGSYSLERYERRDGILCCV
jgi:hypothetical protein